MARWSSIGMRGLRVNKALENLTQAGMPVLQEDAQRYQNRGEEREQNGFDSRAAGDTGIPPHACAPHSVA